MFNDGRSKSVIFVSHCILNQNSISDGTADFPGTYEEVVQKLIEAKVGIIQMPCPELMCLGLDRGDVKGVERPVIVENTRIRTELISSSSKAKMENIIDSTVLQIEEYLKNGFEIKGVIGINRSPSCGVNTTSENNEEVMGEGVFIKELKNKMNNKGIAIKMIGVKSSQINDAISSINRLLE